MALIPAKDDEGVYTKSFRKGLLEARIQSIRGETISHQKVKKILGLYG